MSSGAGTDPAINVLLVEDDEDDFLIIRDMLDGHPRIRCRIEWVRRYDDALAAFTRAEHDVYLIDYRLGSRTGIELFAETFRHGLRVPVIMLTGESDYQIDLDANSLGVTDFLTKQELTGTTLERSIRYAISHHRAIQDLARSEERYALALRGANDGIWDWDIGRDRVYRSSRWQAILGLPEADTEESRELWLSLVYEDDLPRLRAAIEDHLGGRSPHLQLEHRMRHGDGSWRWVLTRGVTIDDEHGNAVRMAGSMSDITERRNVELRLEHDALHDALTDLPNRVLFMNRLEHALGRCRRDPAYRCSVLFLDIDRFKLVNDSMSHTVGDRLLVALAHRLATTLRPGDTVARIGGDEFAILLEPVSEDSSGALAAARLVALLERPFVIDGRELFLRASIGIAINSAQSSGVELLRNADIAMYDAKRRGEGGYALFNDSMHRRVVDRLALENDLRRACDDALLRLAYQPIVDLATGSIRAFEALLRWPLGWREISPREFVPIAEETGLIGVLGRHVLGGALAVLAAWRAAELVDEQVYMSVNVSARQLEDGSFPEQVSAALHAASLPPSALRLEITESTVMHEGGHLESVLAEISATGVRLHLDDFGTGYSSLSMLHRLPVEALKIDRGFVAALGPSSGDHDLIVRSTVALAHSLGVQVIAEGIEEPAQLQRLRSVGCEYGQGYLFSAPVWRDRAEELFQRWPSRDRAVLGDRA